MYDTLIVSGFYSISDVAGELQDILLCQLVLPLFQQVAQAVQILHSYQEIVADLFAVDHQFAQVFVLVCNYIRTVPERVHYRGLILSKCLLLFQKSLAFLLISGSIIVRDDRFYFQR